MKEKLNLYYDMDNVLFLFSEKGEELKAIKSMWRTGYFENLKPFDNSVEVLTDLWNSREQLNIDIFILSTCIKSKTCKEEKTKALKKYLPFIPPQNVILIQTGDRKADFCKTLIEQSILIDDYKENLNYWTSKGGIVIKKRFSHKANYKYIIRNHSDIYEILNDIRLGV